MTITDAGVYYDMYDRDIYASPYETFRRLRNEAPVYYNEKYNFYALSQHDDLARVLTDRETFISSKGGVYHIIAAPDLEMPPGLFIFEDPPAHTMHRSLVSRLFTPRAVSASRRRSVSCVPSSSTSSSGRIASISCGTSRFDCPCRSSGCS